MIDKIIYIYWYDKKIAKITFDNEKYWYQIIEKNLHEAESLGCPVKFVRCTNETNIVSDELPLIFNEFHIENSRTDLIKKFDILDTDNEFERLYKISQNSDKFLKIGFWISDK